MLNLGFCPDCGASFPSPTVTDRLCPECERSEPVNDPTPYVDTDTDKYSLTNLRERLGVAGNLDD